MELALYETRQQMQALVPGDIRPHGNGHRPTPAYEWGNILDRMMINLYNGVTGAMDKAREEARDKHLPADVVDRAEALLRAHRMKEADRKARGVKTPRITSKMLPDRETREMYVFLKQKFALAKLAAAAREDELTRCVLRYASLGQGGQQWALNRAMMARVKKAGIQIEAFASPFNNYFPRFFSIFRADAPFGSLGSFFSIPVDELVKLVKKFGLYANPPFTAAALEAMSLRIEEVVQRAPDARIAVITPTWTDAAWYARLDRICKRTEKRDEAYFSLGEEFRPRFTTSLWTHGVDAAALL
jgi:hypothetical protein